MNREIIVNHTNKLNKYINEVTPKIINVLSEGYKIKNNGELHKKYYDKVYNIINENKPKNIRCFLSYTQSNTLLKFDISYPTGEFSNSYIKDYQYITYNNTKWCPVKSDFIIIDSYIKDEFYKRPIKTLKQVLNVINKINKLNNKKTLINDKISNAKKGFNNYLAK
tara:strand:- start:1374 stop:1871 length:498 start_codon:yes stop_codon:yes gene_type:complete